MLEVHARALVAGELGVAGDHRRLRHRGDAVEPEGGADRPLVHHAVARQRAVLLVQRQHAAAQALVLERLAQHAGALDGLAVVAEAERPLLAQLGHLGELLALQAARDGGQEADRDARLAGGGVAQRSAAAARSRAPGRCWASRSRRSSRRRRRRGCRCRGPPCAPGRACAGGRGGRRRPAAAAGAPPRRSPRPRPRRRRRPARPARRSPRRGRSRRAGGRCRRAGRARGRRAAAARRAAPAARRCSRLSALMPAALRRRARARAPAAGSRAAAPAAWPPPAARTGPPSCTTTPASTWAVMTAWGESTISPESSTPRLTGPGVHQHLGGRQAAAVELVPGGVLAQRRDPGLVHALVLHAQGVDDVGGVQLAQLVADLAAELLDPARDQRRGPCERDLRSHPLEGEHVRAGHARVGHVARRSRSSCRRCCRGGAAGCRRPAAPGSGARACRRRR